MLRDEKGRPHKAARAEVSWSMASTKVPAEPRIPVAPSVVQTEASRPVSQNTGSARAAHMNAGHLLTPPAGEIQPRGA